MPAPCGVRPECASWKYRTHPSSLFPSPLQPQFNELGVLRAPLQNTCQSTSASLHLTLPPLSKPPVFSPLNSCSRLVPIYLPPDAPSVSSTAACGLPSMKICHFAPCGEPHNKLLLCSGQSPSCSMPTGPVWAGFLPLLH